MAPHSPTIVSSLPPSNAQHSNHSLPKRLLMPPNQRLLVTLLPNAVLIATDHMPSSMPPRCLQAAVLYIGILCKEKASFQQFVKHWHTNTMISKMLSINFAWRQWQAGLSNPILEGTTTPQPHLECRWLRKLRDFWHHASAKLHVDKTFVQKPKRIDDFYIMD